MRTLFQTVRQTLGRGEDLVLVTIVSSSGSTPRGAGAHMLVDRRGWAGGTIGGGAVENQAILAAGQVLEDRACRTEVFRLHQNEIRDLGMVCGGEVTVFFQYLSPDDDGALAVAEQAEVCFAGGTACWLIADVTAGGLSLYSQGETAGHAVPKAVTEHLSSAPGFTQAEGHTWYTELLLRPGRVYIFGGGHVAQALVPVLAGVEFRCVILEDRPEFCRPELFPGVEETRLLHQEEWDQLSIGPEDYICIMTRGHKNDTDCQAFALRTPARYIGVIGSRKKIAAVNAELKRRGFTDDDLARITTPIGLPILAETPAEIAISIAAQLIQVRALSN